MTTTICQAAANNNNNNNYKPPSISLSLSKIYGPGLDGSLVLPVRYFFLQLVDLNGNNFTESPGNNIINQISSQLIPMPSSSSSASSSSTTSSFKRTIIPMDLHNGQLVFRFRLYRTIYHDMNLHIYYNNNNQQFAFSPIYLPGPFYSEMCSCPQYNLSQWLNYHLPNCPTTFSRIEKDFEKFNPSSSSSSSSSPFINPQENIAKFEKLFGNDSQSVAACRYVITAKDNRIYRRCYGQHVAIHTLSDALLLSLKRKIFLPNLDFIMNLGDYPLALSQRVESSSLIVLSWCGSETSNDIVLPTYDLMETVLEMLGRQVLDVFHVMSEASLTWKMRKRLGFWRGRDSSNERLKMVKMSLNNQNKLNARLTAMFFFSNDSQLGELSPRIAFTEHFDYAYLPTVDGTVAAYRVPLLLAGGSLILKQASPFYEYFYDRLEEWKHFIPIKRDLSDLIDWLNWAMINDQLAETIALNGKQFVMNNLLPHHVLCYHARVLERYGEKMIKSSSSAEEEWNEQMLQKAGFEEVVSSEIQEEKCDCFEKKKNNREKRKSNGNNQREDL